MKGRKGVLGKRIEAEKRSRAPWWGEGEGLSGGQGPLALTWKIREVIIQGYPLFFPLLALLWQSEVCKALSHIPNFISFLLAFALYLTGCVSYPRQLVLFCCWYQHLNCYSYQNSPIPGSVDVKTRHKTPNCFPPVILGF